jgi:hypothetical protein
MRLAAIAGHEAGVRIIASAHDAFWIAAPLTEVDDAIATMRRLVERAGEAVAGIKIPVETSAVVRWPHRLGDVRPADAKGAPMWSEIQTLLDGGLQQARREA